MFERFTGRARQVVELARDEARALNHTTVGTEHLVLGLLRDEGGVVADVLARFDVTLADMRARVAQTVGAGAWMETGDLPLTPFATQVLERSVVEADALGRDAVDSEHILLALVHERDALGARLLRRIGGDAETIRDEVFSAVTRN
jgi:ATP-dependent Clp protease ATP-binding subunit ClpC